MPRTIKQAGGSPGESVAKCVCHFLVYSNVSRGLQFYKIPPPFAYKFSTNYNKTYGKIHTGCSVARCPLQFVLYKNVK